MEIVKKRLWYAMNDVSGKVIDLLTSKKIAMDVAEHYEITTGEFVWTVGCYTVNMSKKARDSFNKYVRRMERTHPMSEEEYNYSCDDMYPDYEGDYMPEYYEKLDSILADAYVGLNKKERKELEELVDSYIQYS